MSVGPVLTLGLGAFTGGGVKYLPTLGYGTGGVVPPPPVVITTAHPGVGKGKVRGRKGEGRKLIVRLSEVESREDTAEFLKSQLRLRHPESAFVDEPKTESRSVRMARERLAAETKRAMEVEQAEEARKKLVAKNNAILLMLLLS